MRTPCDEKDPITGKYECPYADTYMGYEDEMCRNCCGLGVDEDEYSEEEYEEYDDYGYEMNMPCDTYGPAACSSSCSNYARCQGWEK